MNYILGFLFMITLPFSIFMAIEAGTDRVFSISSWLTMCLFFLFGLLLISH